MHFHFSVRLLQILSFVCNNTQPAIQLRDACYGCFLRSVSLPAGPPQLFGLSQCSNLYLLNGNYQVCAQGLTVIKTKNKKNRKFKQTSVCAHLFK